MKLYTLLSLIVILFSCTSCRASPVSLSSLLSKVNTEKVKMDNIRKDLDSYIINSYLDKHKKSMDKGIFKSEAINIMVHIKNRMNSINCDELFKNDKATLSYIFRNLNYLNYKCFTKFKIEGDIDYLLFYVGISNSSENLLARYTLMRKVPDNTMKAIYDMAFVYCDKYLINYLAKNGFVSGKIFSREDYIAREESDLHSCS